LLVAGVKDYAIILLDRRGAILSWNDGARLIKGYRAHEIVGQRMSRFYTPEDVRRGHPARLLKRTERQGRRRGLARAEGPQPVLGGRCHHRLARRRGAASRK